MSQGAPIVIVDDDESIRSMVVLALEVNNRYVIPFSNAASLLTAIQEGLEPSMVFLDLRMPDMTGGEFLQKLRATKADVPPVILVTADIEGGNIARELNAADFLPKPFNMQQLVDKVEQWSSAI